MRVTSLDTFAREVNPSWLADTGLPGYGERTLSGCPGIPSIVPSSDGVMTFRKQGWLLMYRVSYLFPVGYHLFIGLLSGYTVFENVYIINGTVYLVSDAHQSFPSLDSVVLTTGKGFGQWKLLSAEQGRQLLGPFGSTCVSLPHFRIISNLLQDSWCFLDVSRI